MRNGGRVSVGGPKSVTTRIKIRVVTFDTNQTVNDSTQTNRRCFNPEASSVCSQASQQSSL
jgi:hypothetical protein